MYSLCKQIDMDTIETSNLNRQFLFRKHHVKESKARIAAQAVQAFRPGARIVPHQAGVSLDLTARCCPNIRYFAVSSISGLSKGFRMTRLPCNRLLVT